MPLHHKSFLQRNPLAMHSRLPWRRWLTRRRGNSSKHCSHRQPLQRGAHPYSSIHPLWTPRASQPHPMEKEEQGLERTTPSRIWPLLTCSHHNSIIRIIIPNRLTLPSSWIMRHIILATLSTTTLEVTVVGQWEVRLKRWISLSRAPPPSKVATRWVGLSCNPQTTMMMKMKVTKKTGMERNSRAS